MMSLGTKVFFSYNSLDEQEVKAIASYLKEKGVSVLLDRWFLNPSDYWPDKLERLLNTCDAICIFIGKNGLSNWQQRERDYALDRETKDPNFQIYPILLPGSEPVLGFLKLFTRIDLREENDVNRKLDHLIDQIHGGISENEIEEYIDQCPYQGLKPFREEDAPFFFGRNTFINDLTEALKMNSIIAVVGASGSGKSSVVHAGLVPHLRTQSSNTIWEIVTIIPHLNPFKSLAGSLLPLLKQDSNWDEIKLLKEVRPFSEELLGRSIELADIIQRILAKQPGTDRLLLVIDQFEELYTLSEPVHLQDKVFSPEQIQELFVGMLMQAIQDPSLAVVLTLRGDFMNHMLASRQLVNQLHVLPLAPFDRSELLEVIQEPAKSVGISFEPGLVERILDEVGGQPGNLPLLEFALLELWKKRESRQLTHSAYKKMKGVRGALAQYADEVYDTLRTEEEKELAKRILIDLVHPGDGAADTKRRSFLKKMEHSARTLAMKLATKRLLVTSRDDATGDELVELTHEALIKEWGLLNEWVDENRLFLNWKQQLRIRVKEWERASRDEGSLLRGSSLFEAEKYLRSRRSNLDIHEREYVESSIKAHNDKIFKELEQQRKLAKTERLRAEEASARAIEQEKATRRFRWTSLVAGIMALASIIAALKVLETSSLATKNLEIANFNLALDYESRSKLVLRDSLLDEGWLYAVQVAKQEFGDNNELTYSRGKLLEAGLIKEVFEELWVSPVNNLGFVRSVSFNKDGSQIVSGSEDGIIRTWDIKSGQEIRQFLGHRGWAWTVAYNKAGDRIVSGSEDGTIRLWNVANGEELNTFVGHKKIVRSVIFSSDDSKIISGSEDGTVRIWDIISGEQIKLIQAHAGSVMSVATNTGGDRIVSSSDDGTIRIWDTNSGKNIYEIDDHNGQMVRTVAFSFDGNFIASGSKDKTIRIYNANTGAKQNILRGHDGWIRSVSFSRSGKKILSSSSDGTIRIWNLSTGKEELVLKGHRGWVMSASFNEKEDRIISSGEDGTIRLWNAKSGNELGLLTGHTGSIIDTAISYDGEYIASSSDDRSIRLWSLKSGQEIERFFGHNGLIRSLVFSKNGENIISSSDDGTVRVWNIRKGEESEQIEFDYPGIALSVAVDSTETRIFSGFDDGAIRIWDKTESKITVLKGHKDWVTSLVLSNKGDLIASGSADGTIRIWDILNERQLAILNGHSDVVNSVAFAKNDTMIVSGSNDETIRIWDTRSGIEIKQLWPKVGKINSVVFGKFSKRVISGSEDGSIRFWNISTGKEERSLNGHTNEVSSLNFHQASNHLVSGSSDGTIRLWTAYPDDDTEILRGHKSWIRSMATDSTGNLIVSGSDDLTVRLWDTRSGENLHIFEGHDSNINSVDISASGDKILSGTSDGFIRTWDLISGEEYEPIKISSGNILAVAFDAVGERILSATSSGTIQLWDGKSRKEIMTFSGHTDWVRTVGFNTTKNQIISGSDDRTVRLWSIESGEEVQRFEGHTGWVLSVEFSPDGSQVLSSSEDGTIRIWDIETGEELRRFIGHTDWIRSASFSKNGDFIISGADDKTIRLWNVSNGNEELQLTGHSDWIRNVYFNQSGDRVISSSDDSSIRIWDLSFFQKYNSLISNQIDKELFYKRVLYLLRYRFTGSEFIELKSRTFFIPNSDVLPSTNHEYYWLDRPRPIQVDPIGWILLPELNAIGQLRDIDINAHF